MAPVSSAPDQKPEDIPPMTFDPSMTTPSSTPDAASESQDDLAPSETFDPYYADAHFRAAASMQIDREQALLEKALDEVKSGADHFDDVEVCRIALNETGGDLRRAYHLWYDRAFGFQSVLKELLGDEPAVKSRPGQVGLSRPIDTSGAERVMAEIARRREKYRMEKPKRTLAETRDWTERQLRRASEE